LKSYIFKVVIEPDKFEDGRPAWHVFAQHGKVARLGATPEEALANVREAIDLYVQDRLAR